MRTAGDRLFRLLSRPSELSLAARLLLSVLIAVAAIAVRALPNRFLDEGSPFLVFSAAVVISALYLGLGPALLCLGVSIAALVMFFAPNSGWLSMEAGDLTDLGLFIFASGAIVLLLHAHRVARERLVAAKEVLEAQTRQLMKEVADRRRAEVALLRSNTDLEDFAHIVSHDLKEPLRGISLTAEFVLEDYEGRLDEAGREKLRTLARLPRQMAAQLTALLEYSRIGRSELALTPAPLERLVGEVVEQLGPWLGEHNAEVVVRGPLPTVRCDPARARQVLTNLISNGVKYNTSSPRRVEISAERAEGVHVVSVRDNGIGIDPRFTGDVFRMFRRLHQDGEYDGGTGSGLALVQKTVERHGGRIWFDSEPGRGSVFRFTLEPTPEGVPEAVRRSMRRVVPAAATGA